MRADLQTGSGLVAKVAVLIVVSGVLVLVALIFLIIGLLGDGLTMIWLSIGTSVVAGVFLLLGALQRRGAPVAAGETAGTEPDQLERVTAVSVHPRAEGETAAAAASEGDVAVVPGRPRYHVESCRFLAGRPDVDTIPVERARDEGYTACGVCKPDAALAAATPEPEPVAEEEPVVEDEPATQPLVEVPATPAKKAPAKRARSATGAGSRGTAATGAGSRGAGATAAAATGTASRGAAATAAVEAPAKPAKKAPAKATAAQVVVIPDRGKFHVETCRFVKDVPGTVTLTKASAKRQGYAPCGVCKP